MRWNEDFMELLNINFFFLVHFCPCAKFDENSGGCSLAFGDVDKFDHEFMGTLCHACKIKCTHYPRGDGRE
jgi:hypothetical protein